MSDDPMPGPSISDAGCALAPADAIAVALLATVGAR